MKANFFITSLTGTEWPPKFDILTPLSVCIFDSAYAYYTRDHNSAYAYYSRSHLVQLLGSKV